MAGTQTLEAPAAIPSAVVWINGGGATVATMSSDGRVGTRDISRGPQTEHSFLVQVIREIGDRQRVMILGPSTVRLALERDYVALFHRPDRLVDVEPSRRLSREELVDRVRTLST